MKTQIRNYSVKNETEAYPKLRPKSASQHKADLPRICDWGLRRRKWFMILKKINAVEENSPS